MSDNVEILDFLRARFARTDEALADIKADIRDLTGRVGRLERSVADIHVQLAEHSVRMDRLSSGLDRVLRRLDLVDAP